MTSFLWSSWSQPSPCTGNSSLILAVSQLKRCGRRLEENSKNLSLLRRWGKIFLSRLKGSRILTGPAAESTDWSLFFYSSPTLRWPCVTSPCLLRLEEILSYSLNGCPALGKGCWPKFRAVPFCHPFLRVGLLCRAPKKGWGRSLQRSLLQNGSCYSVWVVLCKGAELEQ